ncbi:MAG: tripartite tricarboxylate transporter permease [Rhodospirillaceae bacterium]|nr:tripartite tricarboxylate transporter permease [Rhodospirillales bacterium]MBT3904191.1 tripartite tricarboxylate transporter permease [Rhodospirillaceae bacterium]MBT5034097.1 tripartite tricarboxylate transporter permease [Rhodospirillaceae bacterium]MBT6220989.1 tripartite tricarboxylate transporter permease [Rhodospirillaceae bacterium]MBT7768991.1 tripartite tricarboxylate transporter permease [Rhodospirillales bacterium]
MIDAMWTGLVLIFQWPALGYLFLGVFIGMWMGAVPGLGGVVGLVILLPFTFGMETVSAFALLLGMYTVTSTSDTIASVMLGIPGTVASQATILDGYPLAKKGQADRAFGAAFTVSAFGGVFGAAMMALSLPILLPIILSFGLPEFFMLAVLGLAMVGALAGRSISKGLAVAVMGLLLTTVGEAVMTGDARFAFDSDYLIGGLPMIAIVLGLFGVPELMEMAVKDTSISRVPKGQQEGGGMRRGIHDAFEHWWLAVRCALIGTYVGMLPGLGSSVVDWIAYGHAVQSAKDTSKFGTGDIRGVIAPESANNATKAGALIPTVAFGIPGSLGTAILLGALVIQGLKPGPEMLTTSLHITFSMVWDIVLANILAAGVLMIWSRQIAKIAFLPGHSVVPGVLVFILMGAWVANASIGDWWVCLVFGVLGYTLKQGGWPRPPLVLALVLGSLMEENLHLSLGVYGGIEWLWERPIVIIINILILATLYLAAKGIIKTKAKPDASKADIAAQELAEGGARNPMISLPITLIGIGVFVFAHFEVATYESQETREFPEVVLMFGIPLMLLVLFHDVRETIADGARHGYAKAWEISAKKTDFNKSMAFMGYLAAILAATYIIGQHAALTIFCFIYLMRWGGYGWKFSAIYSAIVLTFITVFYGEVMNMFFYESWLFG